MFLILLLFFNFCHKNLHIFALPSSAVLKPAQAGLVYVADIFSTSLKLREQRIRLKSPQH
jgi:hypothetical protein